MSISRSAAGHKTLHPFPVHQDLAHALVAVYSGATFNILGPTLYDLLSLAYGGLTGAVLWMAAVRRTLFLLVLFEKL